MKQTQCKLCGAPFVCDNGMWSTTCECAKNRPEELAQASAAANPKDCAHEMFDCTCDVARVEDIGRFMVDVRVRCLQCGVPFVFLGLPLGMDYNSATVSFDGQEARMGIAPKGVPVPPVSGVEGFTIRKTKGE